MNPNPALTENADVKWFGIDLPDSPLQSEVVKLNSVDEGTGWFFVHDVYGNAQQFSTLASQCSKPFYGIELSKYSPMGSIQELALVHIAGIRKVQRTGPYVLGGFSFGALVAAEIAVQLERAGDKVEHLILVDIVPYSTNLQAPLSLEERATQSGLFAYFEAGDKSLFMETTSLLSKVDSDLVNLFSHPQLWSLRTTAQIFADLITAQPERFHKSVRLSFEDLFPRIRALYALWNGEIEWFRLYLHTHALSCNDSHRTGILWNYKPANKIEAPTTLVRIPDEQRVFLYPLLGRTALDGPEPQDLHVGELCNQLWAIRMLESQHATIFGQTCSAALRSCLSDLL